MPAHHLGRFPSVQALIATHAPTTPVKMVHPAALHDLATSFLQGFPGRVLYAVKANPGDLVLTELHAAGIRHFDTASLQEIQQIRRLFADATCYFMAPAKLVGAAETAYHDYHIRHFVADHQAELDRLLSFADPSTTLHIRLKAGDDSAVYELSSKFGLSPEDAVPLMQQIRAAGCRLGISFHVGSLCLAPDAFVEALQMVRNLTTHAGIAPDFIDIGGGFPSPYPGLATTPPAAFLAPIAAAIADLGFDQHTTFLCEPGRALVTEGQSLLVQVIAVKDDMIFINDGIYGNINELNISGDTVRYPPTVRRADGTVRGTTRPVRLSGPTCDTLDVLPYPWDLPVETRVGDWIELAMAGAYSNAVQTRFNGFDSDHWAVIDDMPTLPPTTG